MNKIKLIKANRDIGESLDKLNKVYNILSNKYSKVYISIIMLILVMGLVTSVDAATLGNYGVGQCVQLKQTCDNCSYVNITSLTAVTNNGASVKLLNNVAMTKNGVEFNYTYCGTNYVGEYTYITSGNPNGIVAVESVTFNIGTTSIILLVIVFLLIYSVGFFGFFGKHIWISMLGGLAMIGLGIFLIMNGIDIYRNFITNIIAWTTLGLGVIFALVAGIELIEANV